MAKEIRSYTYDGHGKYMTDSFGYGQAVSIPASARLVYTAGQGGWDSSTGELPNSTTDQIKLCFKNIEIALAAAGAKPSDVIRIESYHVGEIDEKSLISAVECLKHAMPQKPTWTALAVAGLAQEGMLVEIQATAAVL